MTDMREKAKKAIEKTMQTECVAIERLEFTVPQSREPLTWVEVDAIVGQECRPMRFHMEWDGETEDFRSCLLGHCRKVFFIGEDMRLK